MLKFICEFTSTVLKPNIRICVERALITACIILGGVITTDANNIEHIWFLEGYAFSKLYGFTWECILLLIELNMLDKLDSLKK